MTDEKSADKEENVVSLQSADRPADEPADTDAEISAEETADPAQALDLAKDEIVALKDQALRAHAEVENVLRRAARDVENAHKYALERLIGDLLPVLDSLEKAVESRAAAQAADESDPGVAIAQGVELSLKLFLDVLGRAVVAQIDPLGEPFDPQHHEAIAMLENPDAEPNSVLEVMQKGYTLNGRLARASRVQIAKKEQP